MAARSPAGNPGPFDDSSQALHPSLDPDGFVFYRHFEIGSKELKHQIE
jgi:hypothetical protein